MKKNFKVSHNETGYILQADGEIRLVTRDEESHRLIGTLLIPPTVGQAVVRFLTKEETEAYASLRRTMKAEKAAEKAKAEKAEKQAAEKAAKQAERAEAKKSRQAAEAERKELREISREIRKLEAAEKAEEPEKAETSRLDEIKAEAATIKAYINACEDIDPEGVKSAREQLDALRTEYKALVNTSVEKAEKETIEPIGKPDKIAIDHSKPEKRQVVNWKRFNEAIQAINGIRKEAKDEILSKFDEKSIKDIVLGDLKAELMTVKYIGEKHAETIIKYLEERIPDALAMKKLAAEIREQIKAEHREKASGYSCGSYAPQELFGFAWGQIDTLQRYQPSMKDRDFVKVTRVLGEGEKTGKFVFNLKFQKRNGQLVNVGNFEADNGELTISAKDERLANFLPIDDKEVSTFVLTEVGRPEGVKAVDEEVAVTITACYRVNMMTYVVKVSGVNEVTFPNMVRKTQANLAEALLDAKKAFAVRKSSRTIVRLTRSATSVVLGVDCESKTPTNKIAVIDHSIQEVFDFHWSVFADDEEKGKELKEAFQKSIERKMLKKGVAIVEKDGTFTLTTLVGSSAGHQKNEKIVVANARLMKEHEDFFWFGKTMEHFVNTFDTTGAEFMKARANLLRPLMKPFTSGGVAITFRDALIVKEAIKAWRILNGRKIGKMPNGKCFQDGSFDEDGTIGDGAMVSTTPVDFQGQCSGVLFKGLFVDGTSSAQATCKKHNITMEDFLNREIEGADGKMHRVGDYKFICGEGCWKGDRVFHSYDEYAEWMERVAMEYPGLDQMFLLRQAEEIEDEEKVRHLTRTLIMQWMFMSGKEMRELSKKSRKYLRKAKTFTGAVEKLAGLFKTEEERTEVERLFGENPWLVTLPVIQDYLKENWQKRKVEAAAGKFKTEGQYPYIMQDPVALFECWVLLMDPNDPTLGILANGEVSCADVPDGRKLLCVRFPANYLTARVRINRACSEEFKSLNGVMVLSVHDEILIIQDGDVDGDEMAVIYNRLAIRLTERMEREFNPPTILFEHGAKCERQIAGSKEKFVEQLADALYMAKKFDSVGLYANLAMKCCYLASIAYKRGDKKACEKFLLWMSAASTGAIVSIDQVKGNHVDKDLIKWLDYIAEQVRKEMKKIASSMGFDNPWSRQNPFIQWYVAAAKKAPIEMAKCLGVNKDNFLDLLCQLVIEDAGDWEDFDFQGVVCNEHAARMALAPGEAQNVPQGVVSQNMIDLLGANWFKLAPRTEDEKRRDTETMATLKNLRVGNKISVLDMALLLWRNESAMAYSMDGRNLWEKKDEYRQACREILKMLAESGDWAWRDESQTKDKWGTLVNALTRWALELELNTKDGKNRLKSSKGSFAMFILTLFAPELRASARKVDGNRFFSIAIPMEDLMAAIERERTEEDEELFESSSEYAEEHEAPAEPIEDQAEEYVPTAEELAFVLSSCPEDD